MESSRKREREKASQRRRMQVKSSNTNTGVSHPLFAEPIERRDSSSDDLQIIAKNVLGDYGRFHSMGINERSKLLGVVDTTPSTPILPKNQNPFESEFRRTSSGSSNSSAFTTATTTASTPVSASSTRGGGGGGERGVTSGLRHPIAEPPPATLSTTSIEKKREREKNRQHSKHSLKGDYAKAGSASKPHSTPAVAGSNTAKRGIGIESSSKPTNIMVVPKKKGTVRPPLRVPMPTSPMSSGASGLTASLSSAPSKSKQPSHPLGDLFQVDMASQQQDRGSSGSHSSASSSSNRALKQRKSRTKTQQQQSQVTPSSSSSTSFSISFATSNPNSSSSAPPKSSSSGDSTVPSTSAPLSSHESFPKPKKSVSVPPNVSSIASVGSKDSIDTKVVFPLSFHTPQVRDEAQGYPTPIDISQIHNLSFKDNSATIQPSAVVETLSRKKEKKRKKKQKKDREKEKMDTSESPLQDLTSINVGSRGSSEMGAFARVTPIPGHLMFADSHVIPSDGHMTITHASTSGEMPTSLKVHIPKPRPSALKITGSSMESEEASVDTGDIHISMLEPSHLSGTAFKKPNLAETSYTASTKLKPHRLNSRRSYLGSTSSEEESDGGRKEAIDAAMSTLNRALESESHSLHPTEMESSSGSSSSSDSSSDSGDSSSSPSSDEDEEEVEERKDQESISPVSKLLLPLVTTITPLKKTPPHFSNAIIISPLADETANMSPLKPTASALPQYTSEWPPTSTATESTFQNQDVIDSESESSSSSDSDDSGSESDSESSDSEDLSSATEDATKGVATTQANPTSAIAGEGDASELVLFGQGTNSGGFSSDDIFGVTARTRLREMHLEQVSDASQESFGFNPTPHPFGSSWSTAQEHSAPPEGNGRSKNRRSSSHEQQKELSQSQPARKRKREPQLQPVARKAPRVATTKMGGLRTANEEGAQRESQHHSQQKRKSSRRESFLSSFSLSETDNSDDSSSEREDGETFMDTSALSEPSTKFTTATTTRSHEVSLLSPLQHPHQHQHQHQQQMENRSDAGGVVGLGQQEPLLHGPGALVVRIPLPLLMLRDQQKPKATVEPYIVNAPNKPPGRRLTSETTDHEDTHMSRCIGHSDRERDVYPRHREGLDHHRTHLQTYSDDYRRGHDSDRPRSRNGRNWDSSHDHRNLSESDQDLPPQARRRGGRDIRVEGREYRGPSWERERDYHGGGGGGGSSGRGTDDYWGDYGRYERRMEYNKGRRQRRYRQERSYGPQHYLQEARRRKHDADKIRDRGVEKAKAYMESVTYFMRHGDAAERESQQQQWDSIYKNPFRMYSDTISIIKHSQAMSGDCKPLLVICSRCLAVLYWRLYLLKQTAASQIQKELQEFFVPPKGAQKSPYPSSFSPLPSPASVSSTGSGCSGGGASQDPSPSATVSVPKHIFNKATEHLTISTYLTQSFELWKHSEILMEQCRDFFANVDRNVWRISQQSAIPHVADWMEQSLRNLRWV